MIYRNGFKEYALSALVFGIPMGVLFGLSKGNPAVGVVYGVFTGLLFSLVLFAFIKLQERQFDKKRAEIAAERRIVCDGGATVRGNGGWMFLTERGIEFYPHKINFSRKELMIPLGKIESVTTRRNQLVLELSDAPSLMIVVSHCKEWQQQITAVKAQSNDLLGA